MPKSHKRKIAKPRTVKASAVELSAAREVMSYLHHRAEAEGVPCELTPCELTPEWLLATTHQTGLTIYDWTIFGIKVSSETGKIVTDDQQPRPGFLEEWNSRALQ